MSTPLQDALAYARAATDHLAGDTEEALPRLTGDALGALLHEVAPKLDLPAPVVNAAQNGLPSIAKAASQAEINAVEMARLRIDALIAASGGPPVTAPAPTSARTSSNG